VDVAEFALRFAALIDGLAIQVVLRDPEVSAGRMVEVCLRAAGAELGFEWSPPRARRRRPTAVPAAAGERRPARAAHP
jgi:hypothetical protein